MPLGKLQLLLDAAKIPASLDAAVGEDEESTLGTILRDQASLSPEEEAIRGQMADEVERAMAPLTEREREVLRLRYGLGLDRELTLEEIGRRLSVTRERVRQIESRALAQTPRRPQQRGVVIVRGLCARPVAGLAAIRPARPIPDSLIPSQINTGMSVLRAAVRPSRTM